MNKIFALRTLSLAIVLASGSINAAGPDECVSDSGTGETLKEWGIWCGVDTFITSLTEQDPTAAGPAETDVDVVLDELGRGDAEEFDPGAEAQDEPEPVVAPPVVPPVIVEPPPVPHIVINEKPETGVGYIASYDVDFSGYGNGYGEGYYFDDYYYDEYGYGDGYGEATNPRVGTLTLDLCEECSDDEDEDDDRVQYRIFDQEGNEVESNDFIGDIFDSDTELLDTDVDDDGDFLDYDVRHNTRTTNDEETETVWNNLYSEGESHPTNFDNNEDEDESRSYFKNYLTGLFESSQHTESGQFIDDYYEYYSDSNGVYRRYVHGIVTPQAEIDSLMAGNVQAVYGGYTSFFYQPVAITVDFGEATFESSFGDGDHYGYGSYYGIDFGIPEDFDMSFTAEGVIIDTELISTSVSTGEGFVQGSFFESGAELIGGAYQVTKQGIEYADVFTTIKDIVVPHIPTNMNQHYESRGYYAGYDFSDGEVVNADTDFFALDVDDYDEDEFDYVGGYIGYKSFYEHSSDDFGSCSGTDACNDTRVDQYDSDSIAGEFSHTEQTAAAEQTNAWEGHEAVVDNGDESTVLKDYWNGYHKESNNNEGGTPTNSEHYFVAGAVTPLLEIQSLISDNRSLVYTGASHNLLQSTRIEVDFGNELFNASLGDVDSAKKAQLGIAAGSNLGFTASGVVSGTDLISTSTSADKGFLQGTFFGPNAEAVGGAYDVTIGGNRIVDVFSAAQGENNSIGKQQPK